MSRAINLTLGEDEVLQHCRRLDVGVSSLEALPGGGVRLVCMSSDGAGQVRQALKSKLIAGDVVRARFRPSTPLW